MPHLPGAGGAVVNALNKPPNPNQGWWGATKSWAGRNIAVPLAYGFEYSGVGNALKGISTTARGAANAAAGTLGTVGGAVGGGLATAGGYATDAVGLTNNAGRNNWEGTKAFVGSMQNATMQGLKDTAGGAADTLTGGLYNYDGTLLDPKQTAVQNMHNEHVQQLGQSQEPLMGMSPETAKNVYATSTGIGEAAADIAGMSGVGPAAGAAVKGLRAAAGVAPAVAAAETATPLMHTPLSQLPSALSKSTPLQAAGVGAALALENSAVQANKQEILHPMEIFPDANEEQMAQINTASTQLSTLPASQKQMAATALSDPKSPEAQQLAGQGQKNYIEENMPNAPRDPQQFGGFMNTMMTQFQSMPLEAQIGMGLGLAGGVMSLMNGLNGGGVGSFLLGALGLGGAGALAAGSGMLGADAQKFTGDAALGLGRAMGMNVPDKTDLSALKADDPVAAATAQGANHGLNWRSSPEEYQTVIDNAQKSRAEKLQQLEQLQSVPTWLRPTVLRSLDPDNIKTVEEANLAANNAQRVYRDLSNPKSQMNKDIDSKLDTARYYQGWSRFLRNPFATGSGQKTSALVTKAARCWAGYEPVPGAKAYSRGSCRPAGSKKTQKEMKKSAGEPYTGQYSKRPFNPAHAIQTLGPGAEGMSPQEVYDDVMERFQNKSFTPSQFSAFRSYYKGLPPEYKTTMPSLSQKPSPAGTPPAPAPTQRPTMQQVSRPAQQINNARPSLSTSRPVTPAPRPATPPAGSYAVNPANGQPNLSWQDQQGR
jgi:hypothetical protein